MDTIAPQIDLEAIAEFCRKHSIRKMSLFGSALRDDFTEQSDIDILVEFIPGRGPGLIGLASMEIELSDYFSGRRIDLNTAPMLSHYYRDEVLVEARVLYEQAQS